MSLNLDPEVASGLSRMQTALSIDAPAQGDLAGLRQFSELFVEYAGSITNPSPDVSVQSFSVPSEDSCAVPLYWHTKSGSSPGSAILYLHGGGMVASSAVSYRPVMSYLVSHSGVPALAVDFRNAPYSAPMQGLQDCYAALVYLTSHRSELGVDPGGIIVAGDSGGGGLSACLTHLVRERQGPKIAKQVLIYPMLDDRSGIAAPNEHMKPFLTVDYNAIDTCWVGILGSRRDAEDVQPTEAAARMQSAADLPPMYLDVGDCGLFRDECLEYVKNFWAVGVPAEFHVWNGCYHGFDALAPEAKVAKLAWDTRVRAIQEV